MSMNSPIPSQDRNTISVGALRLQVWSELVIRVTSGGGAECVSAIGLHGEVE